MTTYYIANDQLRQQKLGSFLQGAAKTIPATATQTIFTVSGGRIIVTSLTGSVTTVIGGTATTLSIGAATNLTVLGSATAITSAAVGTLVSAAGAVAGATQVAVGAVGDPQDFIVAAGTINVTTSATTTGAIQWTITYFTLDSGATVVAN